MHRYLLIIGLIIFGISCISSGCSPEQDAKMREKTDMRLGDLVKAKDRSLATSITGGLRSEPALKQYNLTAEVSHDQIILTGTVSNQKEKDLAYKIVAGMDLERIKTENIVNEIQIDPSLEPILEDYL